MNIENNLHTEKDIESTNTLQVPSIEELKKFEITKETIEEYKHTPIDMHFSNRWLSIIDKNWKKHTKWIYRKLYKKLFDQVDKNIKEPLENVKDFWILGENYYYKRWTETPQDVINKVFSGSKLKDISIKIKKELTEKDYDDIIKKLENDNNFKQLLKSNWITLKFDWNDETFKKRLIIVFKILKSDIKYKNLIEQWVLKNTCYLREGILERLKILNDKLKKVWLQIKIISWYRRQLVQDTARKNFSETNWKWYNFVAKKSPHSTWWAFDVELLTYPGWKPLKTKFNDFLSRRKSSSPMYSEKNLPDSDEIKENRRLLYNLMKQFWFVWHYKEYWHFGMWDPLSEYIRAKRNWKNPNKVYVKYGVIEMK